MTTLLPPQGTSVHGMGTLLDIQGLQTYFRTSDGVVKAVDGVDLTLRTGQTRGVIGENGCGKSVTARSIMRLIGPPGWIAGGAIYFQGRDLLRLSEEQMRRVRSRDLAMIFQDQDALAALEPARMAGHQSMAVVQEHRMVSQSAALEHAQELFRRVGLPERLFSAAPSTLSISMQRRVLLALALARQPALLLADEPTEGLEETSKAQVLALLKDLPVTMHTAVLLNTHDLGVVAELADEVTVLHTGRVVEQGTVGAVLTQPKHPYTVRLLQSPPVPDQPHPRLRVLPGPVPHPVHRPAGCPFAPRCPHVMALCREQEPPLKEVDGGARARCWLY